MVALIAVAAGGAAGSVCRHLIGMAALRLLGSAFPLGTLAVNVLGSFVIGILAVVLGARAEAGETARLLLMTGFLGGFTTFSAFSLDVFRLVERGTVGLALFYGCGSVCLSLAAVTGGVVIARSFSG